VGQDILALTPKELGHATDHVPILSPIDRTDTRANASLDVIVETGPYVLAGDFPSAGQIREDPPKTVERLAHGTW
jgi:hypothetical protein